MGCWYTVSTAFAVRKDALNDVRFNELMKELSNYAGQDDGHLFLQKETDPPVFSFNFGGSCTSSGPSKMDDWIQRIGMYAIDGHSVHFRHEDEDGVFYVGPTDDAKRKAKIEHHLDVIRANVMELEIVDDPMYDDGPTTVDDVVNAIRALVEDRNTLVVGSYPDTQQIDVCFVVEGSCRQDAFDLVADIQNLQDEDEAMKIADCPMEVADNTFTNAAYFTARDLVHRVSLLLLEPDIRRKPEAASERAA